jgi:raffinose synthase
VQVWNRNQFNGIIGAFNIQGSFWDRKKRRFAKTGVQRELTTVVTPWDVACMQLVLDVLPGPWAGAFASLSSHTRDVTLLDSIHGELRVTLDNSASELITIVPLVEGANGVRFGPLGLENMLNSGGAVTAWKRDRGGFTLGVRGEGLFVASSSAPPSAVQLDGQEVMNCKEGWLFESGRLVIDVSAGTSDSVNHSLQLFF